MGKIRTRTIGLEEVEEQQKKEQKERAAAKKAEKSDKDDRSSVATAKEDKKAKKASSKAMEELKAAEAKARSTSLEEEPQASLGSREEKREKTSDNSKKVKIRQIGKKHKDAKKKVDDTKVYVLTEAVALLKKIKYANFDESVELHLNVIEDGLKGELELPNSTGKTVKVKIVDDKVIEELEKGIIDFDVLVTHPSFMPKLAKFARTLGPKGLMPNPKAGTVSPTPEQVAKKFEKGTLRWKAEPKFPLVHQMIGKISHEDKALVENAEAFLASVQKGKIKAAFIKTTMSPSIRITVQ